MKVINYAMLLILFSVSISACAPRMTDAEKAQQQKIMQSILERQRLARENLLLKNAQLRANSNTATTTQTKVATAPSNNEASIKAEIDKLATIPINTGVLFRKKEDGFTVNGSRFIDYEGEITSYAYYGLTGDVTYLVKTDNVNHIIKFARPSVSNNPLTIANVKWERNTWKVRTETGKNLTGSKLLMTSKGFVVVRRTTGFLYTPGEGVQSFAVPNGYTIAKYQTGDISSTNMILIEKIPAREGSFAGLVSLSKDFGGLLGGDGNQDYALYNIKTKKKYDLNLSYSGNKSLYKNHGQGVKTINTSHYYWSVDWFKVPTGNYIVYIPNRITKVQAIHIDTGLEQTIFERMLGIASVYSFIQQNGKIKIVADMGISTESVDDLVAAMTKSVAKEK